MTQTDDWQSHRLFRGDRINRVEAQLSQLAEAQLQTQVSINQMSNRVSQFSSRVDEFIFQSQRLLSQHAGRLNTVESQTERLEAIARKLDRDYSEQKASLAEYRVTTNATLERIDRILDYLVKRSE